MLDNEARNTEALQFYHHPPLDIAFTRESGQPGFLFPGPVPVSARIYLPEIRVVSRVAVLFEPDDGRLRPDLRSIGNTIIAYQCVKSKIRVARVGELVGKHGIPLSFPKSEIDGIAFETTAMTSHIDLELMLGCPRMGAGGPGSGVEGRWSVYYSACSDNKLKSLEWEHYITRVSAEVLGSPPIMTFSDSE
jgi:hypothetical protein